MTKITHDDLEHNFGLMRSDPLRYLAMVNQLIAQDPSDPEGYFSRHQVYDQIGRYDLAMADIEKALSIEPDYAMYRARGNILRRLGHYQEAIEDFNRSEALCPEAWTHISPLFRAECHARLGNEEAALADCARLPDDHRTPGLLGLQPETRWRLPRSFGASPGGRAGSHVDGFGDGRTRDSRRPAGRNPGLFRQSRGNFLVDAPCRGARRA